MCTAITYQTKDHYFGRTLDYEVSYGEKIVITPRNYPFHFRKVQSLEQHYAIIGMALIMDGYPLYYDATNECGLSAAGLNFPGNAVYKEVMNRKENVASFELIPWILGQCKNLNEAKEKLKSMNLVNFDYSKKLPATPLHWMFADKEKAIVVEATKLGIQIYDNPVGVLTNNPTFDMQLFYLNNYMSMSVDSPVNYWPEKLSLKTYSRGMGAMGLPGDLSSMSRFVRAAFTKMHSVSGTSESESVGQFFHILGSVTQQRGCVRLENSKYEKTIYTSCCNMDQGIYYYTTYENHQICAVDMHEENLERCDLIAYLLVDREQIYRQNCGSN